MINWIKKQYNPLAQIADMKKLYPKFIHSVNPHDINYITFTGSLQPHSNMPEYNVKVSYRSGERPRVKILYPLLLEKPPHFFQKTKTLCLYHPDNFKWEKEYSVAKFIIPWISTWIYFYEVWKETGTWYGEEAEHILGIDKLENN